MSGPLGSQQWMYSSAAGFYPYEIDQSLRFNDDDSAYLSRTPASAGNRKTWTWSGWVKFMPLTSYEPFMEAFTGAVDTYSQIGIVSNCFQYTQDNGSGLVASVKTNAVFRDPSAWYHVVFSIDTTQATSTNRVKIYVNGVEQTTTFNFIPSQNLDTWINSTNGHRIGSRWNVSYQRYDGYLAEVNFIDGQALDPTDFGEFKSGVWIPKSYSGTYGTNGFYLDFGNSGSLGADSSGNGNNWTANNLAATDQVLDSPTNNFATLNPLDKTTTNATLSEGNLKYTESSNSYWAAVFGSIGMTSGKYYWEQYAASITTSCSAGVVVGNHSSYNGYSYPFGPETYKVYQNGSIYHDGSTTAYSSTYATGDIIGVCVDADAREVWISINGVFQGSPTAGTGGMAATVSDPFPEGAIFPLSDARAATGIFNFGQDSSFAGNKTAQGNTDANGIGDFYYEPPAGYLALCTANLPDPAIDPAQDDVPEDYFNTVLYTGNGSTQSVTGVGFQPDFIWLKSRSQAYDHGLVDAVRGVTKFLESNTTDAEATAANYTTSFDSDGFSLGVNNRFNQSSATNVAWNWLADNTSGSTNTDGTITSTVSANQKAGFSIQTWTGDASGNATVGHGLSQAPEFIIIKPRTEARHWLIWHKDFNDYDKAMLFDTGTPADNRFGPSAPTSLVYGLYSGQGNRDGTNFVGYAFHSVDGYSKFGSYTGNGSDDGTFVYTGFRPAFVLTRRTDSTANWTIIDTTRSTYNDPDDNLQANSSNAEFTNTRYDILSNGIKMRRGASGDTNASGGTYIYMAFAEMPFKYANAR